MRVGPLLSDQGQDLARRTFPSRYLDSWNLIPRNPHLPGSAHTLGLENPGNSLDSCILGEQHPADKSRRDCQALVGRSWDKKITTR